MFYYLCNSLTVMLFFIFSTLYFNEQVVELKETESIQYVLMIPGVSLIHIESTLFLLAQLPVH